MILNLYTVVRDILKIFDFSMMISQLLQKLWLFELIQFQENFWSPCCLMNSFDSFQCIHLKLWQMFTHILKIYTVPDRAPNKLRICVFYAMKTSKNACIIRSECTFTHT
jgi:hypothetical protein